MPLTPEFKAATITALRNGQYLQERDLVGDFRSLRLCCIGVAAHANGLGHANDTDEASEFIGLTPVEQDEWVEWNDKQLLNFETIAHRIEEKY